MVKEGRKLQHYFAISPNFSMQIQAGAGVYFSVFPVTELVRLCN